MKLLVTGGAGFIGSSFIRTVLKERPDWRVLNIDKLTYAGNLENLQSVESSAGYTFARGDIVDAATMAEIIPSQTDAILNFAAETHVDRSIQDSHPFITTNILGTKVLLDLARERKIPRFIHISTDEVYGSLGETGAFTEESPLNPNSPYAASKAGADLLARSYHVTHKMDVVITRSSNNYGPCQFPEKLIPLLVTNALENKPLPIYGDGRNVRDWTFVDDNARGILAVLEKGRAGGVYNIAAEIEKRNIDVCRAILSATGKPETLIRFVQDRPGHDWRYAMKSEKARALGWTPRVDFERGIGETVRWYSENRAWWERVKSGAYREYYDRMYGTRLEGAG